jgi:peptidyl-prolyl cis-trans isomerase SurA
MIKQFKIFIILFYVIVNEVYAIENRIIIKVNNNIITSIDIFNEMNDLRFFNKNLNEINDEEIYQIALQSLIRNEIKKNEIIKNFNKIELLDRNYLNNFIERTYKSLNINNLLDFKNYLADNKVDYKKYEQKLIIDILWNQIIFTKFENKISINEKQLKEKILKQKKKTKSFNLSEIVFQIESTNDLDNTYSLIKKDIENIGFESAVIKYSISKTANIAGELGWVNEALLDNSLVKELASIPINAITSPIKISGGFLILKKNDTKEEEKEIILEDELSKLINFEKEKQLNSFSNLYFNKIKNDQKINFL